MEARNTSHAAKFNTKNMDKDGALTILSLVETLLFINTMVVDTVQLEGLNEELCGLVFSFFGGEI